MRSQFAVLLGLVIGFAASASCSLQAQTLVLAVGMERVVPGYSGAAIRIERASDNTQQNIGFASGGNGLNTAAVTAFLGTSQGWITELYDQSGAGNNVLAPTSTANMPTISTTAPTAMTVNGSSNLTARNVKQGFGPGTDGNVRYFILPANVSVNKAQASAFLAFRPDYSGGYIGFQSLFEVGSPGTDAFDIYATSGGFQGLTHTSGGTTSVAFPTDNVFSRTQPTVVALVTTPSAAATIYLDGVAHAAGGSVPPSATCAGGYLLAGTGTGIYYGISLFAQYNFLAFELYNGTVSATSAASISTAMLPRGTVPAYNIVVDGDSITQGTGDVYGYDTIRYAEPMLNAPADITNIAQYGAPSTSALGHTTSPTAATSAVGLLYHLSYTSNIYYDDIGTNDIHEGATGATTWGYVMQTLENAKAMGYKTIGTTLLHEYNETSAQATEINNFNALARAAYASHASYLDGLVDYDADSRLDPPNYYNPSNPALAYSVDGTHPNDAGYQVMSSIAAPVFNKFVSAPATSSVATDTPTLPQWGLIVMGVLLFSTAVGGGMRARGF